MDIRQVQAAKKQIRGKVGTAPVPADVSAKCCATASVSILMPAADPHAPVVPALGCFLILQLHQAVSW